jgi:DNA processing protein
MVGSRSASTYGENVVTDLVSGLVDHSITVISGGAFGIDGIAHRSAMALDAKTVAVMAGGLDRLYPLSNSHLLNQIVEKGLIIGELPPGVPPTKWRFLQRNRLIAAISAATVVIEAGAKSGSINTANHALALERPVGAVPGPITSQNSAGCHRLIRDQGAQLITKAADILEMMGIWQTGATLEMFARGPLETRVYDAIGFGPKTLESICKAAGVTPNEAAIALGSLELSADIERHSDKWQRAK